MNVKSTERENNNAKIVVEIEKAEFDAALTQAYNRSKKDIAVPGFRKGKAPRKVIEGMYGNKVFYEEAVNVIFADVYQKAVIEQKLRAVGSPSVSDMDEKEDGTVVLTIETALYPEVTLGAYKGIEVPKAAVSVTDDDVEAEVNRMAERNSRIEVVDRPAKEGDTVNLSFEGFDNGIAFEGGKGEHMDLTLGSHQFVPGFEEALVGMSAGDKKDVDITFPENYARELSGKAVVFKCEIHEVKESILPEIDDEFAKDVSEFDTMEALRADIREKKLAEAQKTADQAFENAAVELAAQNMTAEIPAAMIDEQVDKHMEQFAYQLQMSGMSMEDYAKMVGGDMNAVRENMRPMAETTVRSNVLLSAIVDAEKIEVTDEEAEAELQKVADQYQMELEKVKEAVSISMVKSDLAAKKAVQLIVDNAVAVDVSKKEEAEG